MSDGVDGSAQLEVCWHQNSRSSFVVGHVDVDSETTTGIEQLDSVDSWNEWVDGNLPKQIFQ